MTTDHDSIHKQATSVSFQLEGLRHLFESYRADGFSERDAEGMKGVAAILDRLAQDTQRIADEIDG